MKFLKEKKGIIISFIIGVIIASSITVHAYNYIASDVRYTKKDGTEISVENALNELYNKHNSLTLKLKTIDYSDTTLATSAYYFNNNDIAQKYTYFKISNVSSNEKVKSYQIRGANKSNSNNETLIEDTEYSISDYSSIWINLKGNEASLSYDLILYN